jgi:hypothetical protein
MQPESCQNFSNFILNTVFTRGTQLSGHGQSMGKTIQHGDALGVKHEYWLAD